jgi:hypothetical protein
LTVPAAVLWGEAVDQGRTRTTAEGAGESRKAVDERTQALIQAFLRDGRLVRLPARLTRRKEVLRYLATRDFRAGAWYTERQVNDVLRDWCEGAETDYVSVRRYLVDYGILDRQDAAGDYWLLGAWRVPAPE